MNFARTSLAVVLAVLMLAACGGAAPPPPPVQKQATVAQAVGTPDAGVSESPAYVYSYSPMGKRDPFRSPLEELQQRSEAGNPNCTEPLCQWDLDQLKLVAVVTGDANPIAMVEDPQTRGYIIKRGTKVGKQGGQVTQILRDSITVTEYFATPDGKRNPNPVAMHLKPDAQSTAAPDLNTGQIFH